MVELEKLKADFNNHISFVTKRPGIIQVLAPLYHEDGDMIDVFIDLPKNGDSNSLRISDHGMTLMRLSYSYDIDTPVKRRILAKILSENGVSEERGRLFLNARSGELYPALLQFAQAVAKVSSMQAFKREVVQSLFYESLAEYVVSTLAPYNPTPHFLPIPDRDDLEVDWLLRTRTPIFLYAVKDNSKARLAALACREFQIRRMPFRSVVVHEDFENALSKKDQTRITNAVDKQFTSLADFTANGAEYFARENMFVPLS